VRAREPRPKEPALVQRPAKKSDIDALVDLSLRAYRVSSAEARREFFTDHPRFGLRDVRVGELEGAVVAALVLYPLHAFVRGAKLPVTGIGSVAVSPEHRRRGLADALLRATLEEMRTRGDAMSMLYAFRGDFYRRFGWGLVETPVMLSVPPGTLPASDAARHVRRAVLGDRPAVQALYDRFAKERGHFAIARRPEWWERRLWGYEGEWLVHEESNAITGYLHMQVDAGDGPWKLVITVNEMVAMTPAAHRGLTGYLHGLRDQAVEIVMSTPADAPWAAELADAANLRGELKLTVVRSTGHAGYGAMLRIVDVPSALESLPVSPEAAGAILVEVDDEVLPANARTWRLEAKHGELSVRPEAPRAREALPRIGMSIETLAILAAGAVSPVALAEHGLIDDSRGDARRIEAWFRGRAPFLLQMNAF
jgi:predicted acetyltransferase